jgi:hypothetical protein
MKANFFTILLFFAACLIFSACKKSGSSAIDIAPHNALTYEFQGKIYDGADGTEGRWDLIYNNNKNITGIRIYRPDLFGGSVNFIAPGCAYLSTNSNILINEDINCAITYADGTPIDSSKVYFYQSGTFTSTTSNCTHQSGYVIIGVGSYDLCDIVVNFSVTLVNNKGDKIEIKNGKVTGNYAF